MITNILIVAAGSAAGGVLRYLVSYLCRAHPAPLPYWTLAVNVIGGFCIGLGAAMLMGSERGKLLMLTGFCGGFTTFSAFSLETLELFQTGAAAWAMANIGLNVVLSIGSCWGGYAMGKS
jgi:CrcB protein